MSGSGSWIRVATLACGIVAFAVPSAAVDDCPSCVLGIWDDPQLTANFGTFPVMTMKHIYVGIDFAGGFDGLTGIQFSIAGIRQAEDGILVTGIQPLGADVWFGSIQAPADTSATSSGTGGLFVAWNKQSCREGDQALVRVTLLTFVQQTNKVLRVLRSYPPTNPMVRTPNFVQCDPPFFTQTRVRGGCYILNWDGSPDLGCNSETVAVESSTWSELKALFR